MPSPARAGGPFRFEKGSMCNSRKALFVFSVVLMLSSCVRQNVGRTIEDGSAKISSRSQDSTQEGLTNPEIETATFALG